MKHERRGRLKTLAVQGWLVGFLLAFSVAQALGAPPYLGQPSSTTGGNLFGSGNPGSVTLFDNQGNPITNANPLPLNVGSATGVGTIVFSSAAEPSHVVKTASTSLLQWSGINTVASTRYVMFFNLIALPANGAVPVLQQVAAPGSNFSGYGYPELYSTGVVVACSTTSGTLTVTTTNDCLFHILVNP